MIDVYLSDLFFNYGPAERAYIVTDDDTDDSGNTERLTVAAVDFLTLTSPKWPGVTPADLVQDFYNRL